MDKMGEKGGGGGEQQHSLKNIKAKLGLYSFIWFGSFTFLQFMISIRLAYFYISHEHLLTFHK
jgi:hypothetical protein